MTTSHANLPEHDADLMPEKGDAPHSTPPLKKKRRFGKRLLIAVVLLLSLLFVTSFSITYFFEDEVADAALHQLYKVVETEVSHQNASLSLWRKFPKVSLKVDGLAVQAKKTDEPLLEVQTLYLQFNLIQLLRDSFELQRVSVSHACLHLEKYAENRYNWDVFRSSDDTTENSLSLALAALSLSDVTVCYTDDEQRLFLKGTLAHLTAKGEFRQERCQLKCAVSLSVDTLCADTQLLLLDRQVRMKGMTVLDLGRQRYELYGLNVGFSKLNAEVEGFLEKGGPESDSPESDFPKADYPEAEGTRSRSRGEEQAWNYAFNLKGKRMDLADVLELLPAQWLQEWEGYQLQGLLGCQLSVRGNTANQADVKADVLLEKGLFQPTESTVALKSVRVEAHYETQYPDWETHSNLEVRSFSANLVSGRVLGQASASDFSHPHLSGRLQASLQLADLKELLPQIALYRIGGKADVQLQMDHTFDDWSQVSLQRLGNADLTGSMTLKQGVLQVDSGSFLWDDFSASLLISGQTLNVVRFNGKVQGNRCELVANVSPIYDFIFVEGSKLRVSGQLSTPMLNVDTFFPPVSLESDPAHSEAVSKAVRFPDFLEADVRLKADKLKYDRFEAQKVEGKLGYRDATLDVEDFSLQTLSGKMQLQGRLQALRSGEFALKAQAVAKQVDIQRLFYVLHDFGLTEENGPTHQNIRGKASAEVDFSFRTDSCLVLNEESIDCEADLTVTNGQLLNYKALEALSSFIKLEDLKEVRFETLTNRILIHRRNIQIPEMEVKNNLLNLVLSGNQTFDGDLNYNISLYLSDLLSKKRKDRVPSDEFGEVVEDGKYGVRLHLLVTGDTEHPQFKWNRKKANEGLRQSFKQQGEELKGIFRSGKRDALSSTATTGNTTASEGTTTSGNATTVGKTGSVANTSGGKSTATEGASGASKRKNKEKELNDSKQKPQELDIEDW